MPKTTESNKKDLLQWRERQLIVIEIHIANYFTGSTTAFAQAEKVLPTLVAVVQGIDLLLKEKE